MQLSEARLLCIDDEKTTYLKNWSLLNSNYDKPYLNSSSLKQTKNKHPIFRLENKNKHFRLSRKDLHSKHCNFSNPQLSAQKIQTQQKDIQRKDFYKPSKARAVNKQSILSISPTQDIYDDQRNCSTLNLFNLSNLQKKLHKIKHDDSSQVKGCVFSNMKIAYSLGKNDTPTKKILGLEIIDRDFSKSDFRSKLLKQSPLYLKTEVQENIDKIALSRIYNQTKNKKRFLRYRANKLEESPPKHLKII